MPKFTISKDGKTLDTLTFEGERIELGSANTCKLFIDDLLVSLHQAAFLKTSDGYDIEPIARTPSFTMNGEKVDERKALVPNAVIAVEGYEIRVDFGASAGGAAAESLAPPLPPIDSPKAEPVKPPEPLPPPLPPIDPPKAKPAEPPKPLPPPLPPIDPPKAEPAEPPKPLPPLPPIDPPKPTPVKAVKAAPRETSLPPLPAPIFSEDAPPQEQPPVQSSEPPPLPPLPPLEPPPPSQKAKPTAEAPTQFVIPVRPIGQLVVTAGPLKSKSWPLVGSELKIGREQGQNDILIRHDAKGEIDTSISRRHATIHIEGDYAYIEDEGSVAGTFVNGRPATKGERIPLRSGDEIEIRSAKESTVFRVELGESSPKAAPPPPLPEPGFTPPPPIPSPAPRYEPPPEPQRDSRPKEQEEPRARESIRRRERQPRDGEDNPFAPVEAQGMPQWVWFAIGGVVVVIILILVYIFI